MSPSLQITRPQYSYASSRVAILTSTAGAGGSALKFSDASNPIMIPPAGSKQDNQTPS
jgi:hypothetical protein